MRQIWIFIAILSLAACSLLPKGQTDETKEWSVSKLYSEAKAQLDSNNLDQAIKYFEILQARYPYGRYAQQSQLEVAYAYYKKDEATSAIAACDRFIKLHPNHPSVDYAYYLKGLANFNEDLGIMGKFSGQDLTERDPKAATEAFDTFKELTTRFPNSKYAPDATARMKYLVNALAQHEVYVARYYYKRGAYVAAANRAQYTLVNYAQAPANEEALLIMVKSYDALGMENLRADAERVLRTNFPQSKYLTGEGKNKKPWWQLWN